jgi:DNA-binding IclR family transcriptional regulator
MSAVATLLKLLADGKARSPEQMALETGLPMSTVAHALRKLRSGKYMRSLPMTYEITPAGLAGLAEREAQQEQAPVRPKALAHTMVGYAIRRQPALQAAWGARQ